MKAQDDTKCEAFLETDSFQMRKLERNGRYTVLSEWKFEDFIGIEIHHHKTNYLQNGSIC